MNEPMKPIEVNPSPVQDQTGSLVRDLMLVLTALPALLAVLGTKDVKQIIDYLASTEFAPVLGLLVGGAVIVWRQFIARRKKAETVTLARSAEDEVGFVKGEVK